MEDIPKQYKHYNHITIHQVDKRNKQEEEKKQIESETQIPLL